jgi:hypothetical protein
MFKNILLAILGTIAPFLYSYLTGALPGFPLDAQTFSALLVWLVGLLVGGWSAAKAKLEYTVKTKGAAKLNRNFYVKQQ